MINLKRIRRDHDDAGAMNALINIQAALNEETFITKSGHVLVALAAQGVDFEGLEGSQLDRIARSFEAAARCFDENCRLYQYWLKSHAGPIPFRKGDNPIVQEAIRNRMEYLNRKAEQLYRLETYFVVVYEGARQVQRQNIAGLLTNPVARLKPRFSPERTIASFQANIGRKTEILHSKVESFVVQLRDSLAVEVLDKDRAFRFFRRLLNYAPYKCESVGLRYADFVDYQLCDSALECHRDHLRLDDYFVKVVTLKDPPARTFAHMLRELLGIPSEFIVSSEWKRESNLRMHKLIQAKRRHFYNSKSSLLSYLNSSPTAARDQLIDEGAVAVVHELGACLEALEVKGEGFGQFSMTLVLYDEDFAKLKRARAEAFRVFGTHDAQLTEETYNQLNSFLAVVPGNSDFNLRRFWLSNSNHADLSFLFTSSQGDAQNAHLGSEYLAILETNLSTPYFFNLHCQDVAHTLVLGATGSGKSFLLNFLLMHLQKYAPLTYIFDLGGSYEPLTRCFGGTYVEVGRPSRSFTINPFTLPPTKENLQFLFGFVRVLVESSGYAMTAADEKDLFEQIENLYTVEPEQRRLFTLYNMLNRNLRAALEKWVQGGQYGSWFDHATDNLTFARFQVFDFEGMAKAREVLEPLLFYILHRASVAIEDAALGTTFKILVMDEAWRFFQHPMIKQYIVEALKTWRKRNAGVIVATQSGEDLTRSEMLALVAENCPTKLFLANPGMDRQAYRDIFHLNEAEAELIARLIPKQQMLLKRPDYGKVLNLNVDRKGYWLYTSNPYDNRKRQDVFERYGFEQGLEILARSDS